MEIRQLRYFLAIARNRSFSKASEKLYIAQPALSRQISALEGELGVKLLVRTVRGVEITEAGRKLEEMSDYILRYIQEIRPTLSQAAEEPVGAVALGLPPSLAYLLAPNLVATARERYPGLTLKVIEGFSVFLAEWLDQGRIDIALLTDQGQLPWTESKLILQEDMVLVGRQSLMSGTDTTVPLMAVRQYPLAISNGFHKVIEPWLTAYQVELSFEVVLDSIPIIKEMILRGLFCSILPYSVVHEEVSRGELFAATIVDPVIPRRVVSAVNTKRPVSATIRMVEAMLEEELLKLPVWRLTKENSREINL
jgi:LysR family nitrogen assimilation transcriptional regulator